jgi:hypothetical protein
MTANRTKYFTYLQLCQCYRAKNNQFHTCSLPVLVQNTSAQEELTADRQDTTDTQAMYFTTLFYKSYTLIFTKKVLIFKLYTKLCL